LTCEHNTSESVIKQLSNIPGFIEASTVPGQFDIVALWQAKTSEDIVKNSVERVTNLQGIFHSETLLAYAPFFKA
jgi:nitrate reductase NapAB chaperone NapD